MYKKQANACPRLTQSESSTQGRYSVAAVVPVEFRAVIKALETQAEITKKIITAVILTASITITH